MRQQIGGRTWVVWGCRNGDVCRIPCCWATFAALQLLFKSRFVLRQPLPKRMGALCIGMNQTRRTRLMHGSTERSAHRIDQGLFALIASMRSGNHRHAEQPSGGTLHHKPSWAFTCTNTSATATLVDSASRRC